MKLYKLDFKSCASRIHFPKLTIVVAMLLAFGMTMPLNSDAQRRGGGGGGGFGRSGGSIGRSSGSSGSSGSRFNSGSSIGRSSGSRVGASYGRINNGRVMSGTYGHRGFTGRDHEGFRGYKGFRGLPYWRYGYLPFWGDYFWGIPPYSFWFYLNGYNYYDCDGVYYKKDNDKYEVVPAPIGTLVKDLPKNSIQFTMDGEPYFYYFGTFYIPVKGKYEIVEAPIGAEVDSIPDGYDKVMIDGQTYYTLNGVQYKAVLRDNVIWYQVIKNNLNDTDSSNSSSDEHPTQDNKMGHN